MRPNSQRGCKLAKYFHSAMHIDTNKVTEKNPRGIVAAMKIDDLRTRNFEGPSGASFHYDEDSRSIDRPGRRSTASFFTWPVGDSGTINSCFFSFPRFSRTRPVINTRAKKIRRFNERVSLSSTYVRFT